MNDDDITRRVAETLRAEASTVRSSADAWDRFSEGNMTLSSGPSRRRWLLVPAGLAVAAAAAVIGVALGLRSHSTPPPAPIVSPGPPTVAPTVPPTTVAAPVGPIGGPVPKGFAASSVTFVSASDGWVLGTAPCSNPSCISVARTTDGARTWMGIPAPADPTMTTIRFADRLNGWAFGGSLQATHDGGATWHLVHIPGRIESLEAAGGVAHMAYWTDQGTVRLASAPVASDDWVPAPLTIPIGAGPVPTGQIVLHGNRGWFVQVDRTVVGGAQFTGAGWIPWTPPCATAGGPAVLAATTATDVVAACDAGVWTGGPPVEQLWRSSDGGRTFVHGGDIPLTSVAAIASSPTHVLVAGDAGNGQQSLVLRDGNSWTPTLTRSGTSWSDVGFTTDTQGVAVSSHTLFMTRDGGASWAPVSFG